MVKLNNFGYSHLTYLTQNRVCYYKGRRIAFIASMTFSVIGNLGSASSINIEMLIGLRVISAIGAAAVRSLFINITFFNNRNEKLD